MLNLKELELPDLLDLLMEQTTYHTQLIAKGATPGEFARSREILRELQHEIRTRNTINIIPPADIVPPADITIPPQDHESADISK